MLPGWEDEQIEPSRISWVTGLYDEIKQALRDIVRGAYVGCFDSEIEEYLVDPKHKFIYHQSL